MKLLRHIITLTILFAAVALDPKPAASNTSPSNRDLLIVHLSSYTDSNLTAYTNEFLSHLEKELSKNGVKLIIYENNQLTIEEAAQVDLSLHLQSNQSGRQIIANSWPQKQHLSVISPLVYNTFRGIQWNVSYQQTDKATSQVILELVTALSLYSIKQCDQANQYFSRAEKSLPNLPGTTNNIQASINFYRGNCALISGNFISAARLYEFSRASDPNLTLYTDASTVNLAWTYIKLGHNDEAFRLMEIEVARFSPEYSFGFATTALKIRSQLHILAFQYDQAIADLDLAIHYCLMTSTVTPAFCASFFTLRGQTYLLLYEWDNVLADYNKALELDPTYADAYFYRGVLKYSVLQTGASLYPEALADFQQYLTLAPAGEHAADAARYAADIQTQLAALNN